MNLPKAIICDLDGTLADQRHRLHYVEKTFAYLKNRKSLGIIEAFKGMETWKPDYESFYAAMEKDGFNDAVLEIIDRFSQESIQDLSRNILFITGRPEKYRNLTDQWLSKRLGFEWELFMRPDFLPPPQLINPNDTHGLYWEPIPDNRPAYEVKHDIYNREIKDKYDVLFVLEDEERCCEMYRDLGLQVLRVM